MFTLSKLLIFNYLFQETDEGMNNEMNIDVKADIEVDFEEFCDANNDQANYDGTRWIIICLFKLLML